MTRTQGQILRFLGLLVEMLGILALTVWSRTGPDGAPLPGSFSPRFSWTVIVAGFVLWALGTLATYWPRWSLGK